KAPPPPFLRSGSNDGRENESRVKRRFQTGASELTEALEAAPKLCPRLDNYDPCNVGVTFSLRRQRHVDASISDPSGLFYLLDGIHGFWRDFSLTDTSIQHHYTLHERVPAWALYVIALAAPLVIMPIINIISIRSWWDWHNSWLGLILSLGLTGTITNIVKITAGRPRPDFISRCQPAFNAVNAPVFGLANASICTQTDMKILKDGFRSFFSGHSSLSFAGLGFLFWYLSGKLHLFDQRGHAGKAWICFVPLMGATLVAISRTMDYRRESFSG
ncbi:hypothetical protein FRC01_006391, partial [Tulasnella sp. 417]